MPFFGPWPYAAKAIIQHEFSVDHLNIWITFRLPMRISSDPLADPEIYDLMPPLNKWKVELDAVEKTVTSSEWQDEFTLLLVVGSISTNPTRATVEYEGPDYGLLTTWGKQWEPWGPILSFDITQFFFKPGMIQLWSGSVASIPSGWALCDGSNGTPDLRNSFIIGAGSTYAPGATGGEPSHAHTITNQATAQTATFRATRSGLEFCADYTHTHTLTGTTDSKSTLPPYYALCYIMKL